MSMFHKVVSRLICYIPTWLIRFCTNSGLKSFWTKYNAKKNWKKVEGDIQAYPKQASHSFYTYWRVRICMRFWCFVFPRPMAAIQEVPPESDALLIDTPCPGDTCRRISPSVPRHFLTVPGTHSLPNISSYLSTSSWSISLLPRRPLVLRFLVRIKSRHVVLGSIQT